MAKLTISDDIIEELSGLLKKTRKLDIVTVYLFYLEKKFHLNPVVFMKEKKIYQSENALVKSLEEDSKLWRETEIIINIGKASVNEATKKVYICPFSGKVFGDNTHPNPQDAIYDWVSKCPENTEKKDGLRVKRFFVSDDKEVIKNYMKTRRKSLKKLVYTSLITGKLLHSKSAVVDDLLQNHIKHIPMREVPSQNRFELQEDFLTFIQEHLDESKLSAFVEYLSKLENFKKYVEKWVQEEE